MLDVSDLHIAYGGIRAVQGIDFHVKAGELVALIGANGAGKSSTLNCLAGLIRPVQGQITLAGETLAQLPAHQRVQRGLALVPEGRGLFPRLTVRENLNMGGFSRQRDAQFQTDLDEIYALLPRLAERRHQLAGTLSGGEQQMVAIGRALMSRPRMLLLDEPSMGLAPLLVEQIVNTIQRIVKTGVAVLLVEQNAHLALQISQRAYVLESGRISLSGDAAVLQQDERVRKAYLGE
ncbi:MAG TPA: ABC transporter ATP-binding protein [Pseudomonadales bacterium]|nr:ABC transporter ATP-binding protein [Pseudomonadales bacterium]